MFQVELQEVMEELEKLKLRSTTLEKEVETSKMQKLPQKYNNSQKKPRVKEVTILKSNKSDKVVETREFQSIDNPQADVNITLTL